MDLEKLRELTYENTREYAGDLFQIRFENAPPVDLKLEEVALMIEKHVNPRMQRDTFAWRLRGRDGLVRRLRGTQQPRLAQGVYAFHHEKFDGPLVIFIVPIGASADGVLYEAIFT